MVYSVWQISHAFFFLKGWINTNKRISTKKAVITADIASAVKEVLSSLAEGTITVANLTMLQNVEKFWDGYDALAKVYAEKFLENRN